MRVLLVEDEPNVAKRICKALEAAGYVVEIVSDGEQAWFRGETEDFDAIVLDLGLPQLDGLQVLRRWRAADVMTPVLVLSARGTWMERVEGIDAGADDYLPKPFQMEELKSRLRALVRRAAGRAQNLLKAGNMMLDLKQMMLTIDEEPVELTRLEFRLLSYLLLNRGTVLSQAELSEHVYGEDVQRDSNALEVLIARVRKKLNNNAIQTRRGSGYLVP